MRKILAALLIIVVALGSGCATVNKMALNEEQKELDLSERSIVILSFRMENKHKPSFQPTPRVIYFEEPNAENKEQRQNFILDKKAQLATSSGNYYVVNAALPPGKQILAGISGYFYNLLISASTYMVLQSDLDVPPASVIYVGRITGEIRHRGDDDPPAGPGIPLIDQAVAGYSTGTFDITVTDAYDEDVAYIRSRYPALNSVKIQKRLLPPVDIEKTKSFWKQLQGDSDFDPLNM